MDKRNLDATKAALLKAAEKLMTNCNDPSEVTSRAIAKEADVNLAMINYCFGSREALLYEVFNDVQSTVMRYDPMFIEIISGDLSPKEKLTELHYVSIKMMLEYFNYAKAITKYVLLNRAISADRGSLPFIMAHFGGKKTEGECRLIAYELSSLHELAVLRHEEIKSACGIDLTDDKQLREFVQNSIERYLG